MSLGDFSFCLFLEACFYGNLEIVKVLVENGANVNGNQNDERSPSKSKKRKDQGCSFSLYIYRWRRSSLVGFSSSSSFFEEVDYRGKPRRLCKNLSLGEAKKKGC